MVKHRGTVPIELPGPNLDGEISLEKVIASRRSRRTYGKRPLEISELGQMLWAGLGITGRAAHSKASPSAGATHPLNLFAAVGPGRMKSLDAGFYSYVEQKHHLMKLSGDNFIPEIAGAAYGQGCVAGAPVVLVITIEYPRTTMRYGERGIRYAHMDAGHLGQNLYLQAEALGLSTCAVGAFDDDALNRLLPIPGEFEVKYLFPFGPRK